MNFADSRVKCESLCIILMTQRNLKHSAPSVRALSLPSRGPSFQKTNFASTWGLGTAGELQYEVQYPMLCPTLISSHDIISIKNIDSCLTNISRQIQELSLSFLLTSQKKVYFKSQILECWNQHWRIPEYLYCISISQFFNFYKV